MTGVKGKVVAITETDHCPSVPEQQFLVVTGKVATIHGEVLEIVEFAEPRKEFGSAVLYIYKTKRTTKCDPPSSSPQTEFAKISHLDKARGKAT